MAKIEFPIPLGVAVLACEAGAITRLHWHARDGQHGIGGDDSMLNAAQAEASGPCESQDDLALLGEARRQLLAYFEGRLDQFDVPLAPAGSPFQRRVYAAMLAIPFGQTRHYSDLARDLATVPRAVGGACGSNPIPIIIPCHRVVSTSGLGGFSASGGVSDKVRLLELESSQYALL